jgi:hypothetical protein
LSFELPGGEAGVGIQNVCKSSATPERALAVAVPQQFGTPKESLGAWVALVTHSALFDVVLVMTRAKCLSGNL